MISFEDTQRTLTKNTAENNITEVNPVQQAEAILDDVRFSDDTLSRRRSNADNDASPSEIQKFPQPNSIPEDIPPVTTPPIEHDAREIFGDPTVIAHSHYTHLNQPEIPEQYVIPNETQTAIKLANEAFASAISMVQININTDSQIPDQDKKRLSAFMRKVSKAILEVPTHYANGDDLKNKE